MPDSHRCSEGGGTSGDKTVVCHTNADAVHRDLHGTGPTQAQ